MFFEAASVVQVWICSSAIYVIKAIAEIRQLMDK